jgi:hypothetical protein
MTAFPIVGVIVLALAIASETTAQSFTGGSEVPRATPMALSLA